ncbi:peptidase A4 family-domain-containing protein [Lenzites betulinus]|nr:peptidase A4 family-domain-containing protein [Lenzites betulinus]
MFSAALLCQVLLATATFALPTSKERLAARFARRSARAHQSHHLIPSPSTSTANSPSADLAPTSITRNSTNWSGAVLVVDPPTFRTVTGTFTAPIPSEPSGQTGDHLGSAWVGIDGDTCEEDGILQTGIDYKISANGTVSYVAWSEWFPVGTLDFDDLTVSAGDSITASVTATSTTSGTATLINHSTGQHATQTFSDQALLCLTNADWIVEDFDDGGMVSFAKFGAVTFTDASAHTISGAVVGPAGATIINLVQNNTILTSASTHGNTVTVKYVGP